MKTLILEFKHERDYLDSEFVFANDIICKVFDECSLMFHLCTEGESLQDMLEMFLDSLQDLQEYKFVQKLRYIPVSFDETGHFEVRSQQHYYVVGKRETGGLYIYMRFFDHDGNESEKYPVFKLPWVFECIFLNPDNYVNINLYVVTRICSKEQILRSYYCIPGGKRYFL